LIIHALFVLLPLAAAATPPTSTPCAAFSAKLQSTYGFRPSKLNEAESNAKSKEMDAIWKAVEKGSGHACSLSQRGARTTDGGHLVSF
jgi:hypothetical protein